MKNPSETNPTENSNHPESKTARYWIDAEGTVRDRLWVFCCPPNTDFGSVRQRSLMTAAECGFYLDVPNIIMIQASSGESQYGRFDPPFAQYSLALRPFKRIAWGIVGSGGFTDDDETQETLELAVKTPNVTAVMLDDFFKTKDKPERAVYTVDRLRDIRRWIDDSGKRFDLLVTYYYRPFLQIPLNEYLELIDVVTLWGGKDDLLDLEATLDRVEAAIPNKRIMLGCYMFDFGIREPVPLDLMKHQCRTGLRWLTEGRIEGIIFLGNTVADLDFPAVEWTRQWIRDIGDENI